VPADAPASSFVLTGSIAFQDLYGQDGDTDLLYSIAPPNNTKEWGIIRGNQSSKNLIWIGRYPVGFNHGWRIRIGADFSSSGPTRDSDGTGTYIINGQNVIVTSTPNAWDGS
jgi:hypothetical protein